MRRLGSTHHRSSGNLVDGGDELLGGGIKAGLELLRHGVLSKVAVVAGHKNVHLRGLCRDNVGIDAALAQVHLSAIGLVDGEGGQGTKHLDLHALAVDKLKRTNAVLKDHGGLLAAIASHRVHLALDLDGAVVALVDVDSLLHVSLDDNLLVALLELHHPLAVPQLKHRRRLGGRGSLGGSGAGCGLGLVLAGDNRGAAQGRVLVGHLRLLHLLQTKAARTAITSRVEGSKQTSLGSSTGSRSSSGSGGGGGRGGGRGSSRGRGSSGCLGIGALGVPDQPRGVHLLHILKEIRQDLVETLSPGNVLGLGVLEVLEHTVAVELGRVVHLLDVGSGLGRHHHPAEGRDGRGNGSKVVGEGGLAVGLAE
eukprot:m.222302 g.222302  ORF g.222302 m.222302 type:complete len:366 (+) comp15999_c0_seq1:149-1246(+)